ncbi:MAG: hypothetical protein PVJ42_03180 [bacterium]|jgi:hypothetical protein
MRKTVEVAILLSVAAAISLGGCSSSETTGLCQNVVTAKTSRFYFSSAPNASVRVITTPDANKLCSTDMGIKVRYERDDLARDRAPQNIYVQLAVEDGSGEPPTIFELDDPNYSVEYGRKYIQWGLNVSAADRVEPVRYYIRIGTSAPGEYPVLADAAIRYVAYEAP